MASARTNLSRLRTNMPHTRAGLAVLTLGIALFRLFGPSLWSLFDAGLVLVSLVVTSLGIRGYPNPMRATAEIDQRLESPG